VNLSGNTSTSYTHFSPRVGIAYQLDEKTVIRMGYGRSYDIGVFGSIFGHAVNPKRAGTGKPGNYDFKWSGLQYRLFPLQRAVRVGSSDSTRRYLGNEQLQTESRIRAA